MDRRPEQWFAGVGGQRTKRAVWALPHGRVHYATTEVLDPICYLDVQGFVWLRILDQLPMGELVVDPWELEASCLR